jgi:hypothetical protein
MNKKSNSDEQKKHSTIPFRIDFIKELLNNNKITPMIEVDGDHCETEQMIVHHNHDNTVECSDIRCILDKKIYDFSKVISQIGGKLLYVKSGTTGHTFKGMGNSENYAVKVVPYPKKELYGHMNDAKRPENAELLMIRVLSYFVVNKQSPHIVLPIGTFNTNIKPFIELPTGIIKNKKYDIFIQKYNDGIEKPILKKKYNIFIKSLKKHNLNKNELSNKYKLKEHNHILIKSINELITYDEIATYLKNKKMSYKKKYNKIIKMSNQSNNLNLNLNLATDYKSKNKNNILVGLIEEFISNDEIITNKNKKNKNKNKNDDLTSNDIMAAIECKYIRINDSSNVDELIDSDIINCIEDKYRRKDDGYYDNISILISEWANGGDLLDYLRGNYKTFKTKHWRVIFFQIMSVLAVIQAKYPTFRHNDLKANNVLVQKTDSNPDKRGKFKYDVNGQIYAVPNIGIQIKIWDFDFATIPGKVDNSKVEADWTKKINVNPEQNRYYDVHYFFNTLLRNGFFPEFLESDLIPSEVRNFVDRVLPEKYRSGDEVSERGRILVNNEYTTPDKIIKTDPFFSRMRLK